MSLSGANAGYLDVRNAILRVGTLDVQTIVSGVDTATNIAKTNTILLWDDQGSDLNSPPFVLSSATRSTSPPYLELGGGIAYAGIKLPNAWLGAFEVYMSDKTDGSVKLHMYSTDTTTYGDTGYELVLDNSGVTLNYDGTQVDTAAYTWTNDTWHQVVVGFERGAWTVSVDGNPTLIKDDDERTAVYANAGQYLRFDAATATTTKRVRYVKFACNGHWLQSNTGALSYTQGNVGIGVTDPARTFHVRGERTVWRLDRDRDSAALHMHRFPTGDWTTPWKGYALGVNASDVDTGEFFIGDYGTAVSSGQTRRLTIDNTGNVIIGTQTTGTHLLEVYGTANTGVLTTTSASVTDATHSTSKDTGALIVTQGGLGVESNIHGTNVFAASHLAVGTTDTSHALDINGTANFQSNVYVPNIQVASTAANLVTWNSATGDLMDSGGLISNKLAIVSEQPPSALTAATTTVDGHGKYTVYASNVATNSNAWNAFDQSSSVYWQSTDVYSGGAGGEYLKITFPYKTTLRHFVYTGASGAYTSWAKAANIAGSNDDSAWTQLASFSGFGPTSNDPKTVVVNASAPYKHYKFTITENSGSVNYATVAQLKLFTESFSVDGGIVTTTAASGLETGFTEHPVAPMTDYKTYVEGHGTYEASASSYDSTYSLYPWRAFDNNPSLRWTISTDDDNYNVSTGEWDQTAIDASPHVFTSDVGGTRYHGHWLQIKLPYAITLSHSNVHPTNTILDRPPKDGVILGSNDGDNWYKLTQFTGKTYTSATWTRIDVNATTPYQYFRMCATKNGGDSKLELTEWRLFSATGVTKMDNVLISGELAVDGGALQTSHIKWPKVPLKANESEGYVASVSSLYSSTHSAFNAFEDKSEYTGGTAPAWISDSTSFPSGSAAVSRTTGEDTFNHEWLQIQLPQAIQLSHFNILRRDTALNRVAEAPKSGFMYGSNDGVTWTKLVAYSDLTYVDYQPTRVNVQSTIPYTYYRLAVTVTVGSVGFTAINELQLFESTLGVGTSATTAKLTVDGGLGLAKGSQVFAGSDVITEFPKHDRPLTKYPEVAMTSGTMGGYTTSSSSDSGSNYRSYKAFDGTSSFYITASGKYNTSNGSYTGSNTFEGIPGETLSLTMPKKIKLQHIRIRARSGSSSDNAPKKARIFGSNDNSTWVQLWTFDEMGLDFTNGTYKLFVVNAEQYYNAYTFVIEEGDMEPGTTNSYVSIRELEYYGHEEGDESVDVVHRSIPNTPGTQQLAVYYEARDPNSYSFADSTKVYDLSGSGVTGTLNGVGYDAVDNAWVFDGNGDYISGTLNNPAGAWVHSISFWMKRLDNSSIDCVFSIDNDTSGDVDTTPHCVIDTSKRLRYDFWSSAVTVNGYPIQDDVWYHVCFTYSGGAASATTMKAYIDGFQRTTVYSGGGNALNAFANSILRIGMYPNGVQPFRGSIANFRLYSKALSADQVRELYDYDAERFGRRQNVVALHKGNLGIGLRDPEQRLVVNPQNDVGYFPQTQVTHTGDFAYLHDDNSGATIFNIWTEKDGLLVVSCSSFFAGGSSNPLYPFQVLNLTGYRWQDSGSKYSTTNGSYTGSATTTVDGTSRSGEWIGITFGQPIAIEKFIMNVNLGGNYQNRGARTGVIAARNYEDDAWTAVYEMTGQSWVTNQNYEFFPTSSVPYKEYRFVIETLQGGETSDTSSLTIWKFYGKYASTCNGAVLKTGGVVTGGVIANAVSLRGKSSEAPLTVGLGRATLTSSKSHWITNADTNATTQNQNVTEPHGNISIYSEGNILTKNYIISSQGTLQSSDRRIKTNITDVNDSSALEAFRLIQPKLYNYKDVVQKGTLPVWGFIAQEVADTLTYSTQKRIEYIPNVYELANVYADGTVLEFDTTKLQPDASKLRLYDAGDSELDAFIDEIIDEYTVRLTKPIACRHKVFVYGQEVRDFHFLKKDAIWTTAAAALQEVDRQLQAEKAKVRALEEKDHRVKRSLSFTGGEGLLVDATGVLSNVAQSKDVLGVVAETPGVVETSGEHYLWVCNEQGSLDVGDLLTTSNVAGYATKQDDDLLHNYTVAKALEPCDFTQPQVPSKRLVSNTVNVNYYVHTSNVSLDVYSNLAVDARTTLTETYYEKITRVQVKYNEYLGKMPAYDIELYYKLDSISVSREVYEALPDYEAANYVVESTVDGEPHTYVYRYDIYLTLDEWRDLDEFDQTGYTHGYFKDVVEERMEPADGFTQKSRIIYQKILNTISEPRNGYTLLVRQEQVPVLDAFGNLQYVEDTTEVVDSYDLRYVDADGGLTTRHNAVYLAARLRCILV
jgi:hypothetical protein